MANTLVKRSLSDSASSSSRWFDGGLFSFSAIWYGKIFYKTVCVEWGRKCRFNKIKFTDLKKFVNIFNTNQEGEDGDTHAFLIQFMGRRVGRFFTRERKTPPYWCFFKKRTRNEKGLVCLGKSFLVLSNKNGLKCVFCWVNNIGGRTNKFFFFYLSLELDSSFNNCFWGTNWKSKSLADTRSELVIDRVNISVVS